MDEFILSHMEKIYSNTNPKELVGKLISLNIMTAEEIANQIGNQINADIINNYICDKDNNRRHEWFIECWLLNKLSSAINKYADNMHKKYIDKTKEFAIDKNDFIKDKTIYDSALYKLLQSNECIEYDYYKDIRNLAEIIKNDKLAYYGNMKRVDRDILINAILQSSEIQKNIIFKEEITKAEDAIREEAMLYAHTIIRTNQFTYTIKGELTKEDFFKKFKPDNRFIYYYEQIEVENEYF